VDIFTLLPAEALENNRLLRFL